MNFNFDELIDRRGTHSVKWEFAFTEDGRGYTDHADPKYGDERVLPMWVADMDFRVPQPVIDALAERVQHGVFGYTFPTDSYYEAVVSWMKRRYGRSIQPEWITIAPGIVPAINMMVQAYTKPGDKVLVQPPVYYPFFTAVENNGGEIVRNALLLEGDRYVMDFDDLAEKAADPAVKLAILCSPHNPVSRVWTREELARFGEICLENDVLVISDEIHCDLIFDDVEFTSFASINNAFEQKSIVCTAPSKTFNLAGLKTSNVIIPDKTLRQQFEKAIERNGLHGGNPFGIAATEAAYKHGEAWLAAMMAYVQDNYRFMADYIAEHIPQLKVIPPEGTYLIWVDCRALGLDPAARKELVMGQAKLFLDNGEMFGPEGEGFERFNLACPRSILVEALDRLKTAVTA